MLRIAVSAPARRAVRLAALALFLVAPAAARAQLVVTALDGPARASAQPLSLHDLVLEDEIVETEEGGRCSLMLASQAMIQLCNNAAVKYGRSGPEGPGGSELMRGELQATVGRRSAAKLIEKCKG